MKYLTTAIIVIVVAAAGLIGLAYSGRVEVSATGGKSGALEWFLATARRNAVQRQAADIVPPDLSGEDRLAAGAGAFEEMCAGCHGAPGRDPFVGAEDMDPPPPDLAEAARERSPAELFWVVKHGIRMTGMPAWGPSHADAELWELVALIKRLPDLSAAQFQQLVERGGHGHDHQHGGPTDDHRAAAGPEKPAHTDDQTGAGGHHQHGGHEH